MYVPGQPVKPLRLTKNGVCEVTLIDQEKVDAVRSRMVSDEKVEGLVEIFKVLGDPTRFKMLYALSQQELCVCDLAAVLGMTSSAVSHQLRVLRNLGLVKFRKQGRMAFYFLANTEAISLVSEGLKRLGSI